LPQVMSGRWLFQKAEENWPQSVPFGFFPDSPFRRFWGPSTPTGYFFVTLPSSKSCSSSCILVLPFGRTYFLEFSRRRSHLYPTLREANFLSVTPLFPCSLPIVAILSRALTPRPFCSFVAVTRLGPLCPCFPQTSGCLFLFVYL